MDFSPVALWEEMTIIAKGVIIILAILSVWSLYISVERWLVSWRGASAPVHPRCAMRR